MLLALPDSVEMVWCLLGAWQAGLVGVPVNVQMSRDDLIRDITTAEPALIVIDSETAGWVETAGLGPSTEAVPLLAVEKEETFTEVGDAPALAVFTSGTTGAPKLCFFRHCDLHALSVPGGDDLADTVGLSVSRMYFFAGLNASVLMTLETGRTTVLSRPRATPSAAIELMRRHTVTVLFAQPSFLARLLLEPGSRQVLGDLRLTLCVGEVLTARLRRQLIPVLGDSLVNVYGATEAGVIATGRPADYDEPSAVGPPPTRGSVRILADDGEESATGGAGHLHIRVPFATRGVARGSLGPDISHDVWWPTGDLGSVDDDGIVHVYGRLDDVEVIGGQNVVPEEIERLLETHPRVHEAAVCSVSRQAGDTSLRAYVVGADGSKSNNAAIATDLIELVDSTLSWYKVPADVVWLEALPRNGNGKLLRRLLRAEGGQVGDERSSAPHQHAATFARGTRAGSDYKNRRAEP
ncbi:acyl--CoA ligase [Pseudonocardia sp. ICBG1122]|nr:acyl--CoA ligase [Pseudonocardia pini]